MSVTEVNYIAEQIFIGLTYLHAHNLAHGSLRPSNIFLCPKKPEHHKSQAKTAAAVVDSKIRIKLGDYYCAAKGDLPGDVSDLGRVIYQMLTGTQLPIGESDVAQP